jgi:hypothetical protein
VKLTDLIVLYGAAGLACAAFLQRRAPAKNGRGAALNAAATVFLWPLWAPIAWTSAESAKRPKAALTTKLARIRLALDEALETVRGSPLERLLGRELAETIWNEARRVEARNLELAELLTQKDFDLGEANRRLQVLEAEGVSARALASARLHVENVRRLAALAERDARALDEIDALVSALRTELLMVKLSGSSGAAVDDIVGDLWAQIEGLRQANEQGRASPSPLESTA